MLLKVFLCGLMVASIVCRNVRVNDDGELSAGVGKERGEASLCGGSNVIGDVIVHST